MTPRRSDVITPCSSPHACSSFGAGHNTHTVRATLAGTSPRGWRTAVVEEVNGLCVTLNTDEREPVVIWHHRPLDASLAVGANVRLHAEHALLEIESHWLSVAISHEPG